MLCIENKAFDSESWQEQGQSNVYEGIEFKNCAFHGCSCSMVLWPEHRSVVRDVRVINCSQRGCCLGSAVLENVLVDGLETNKQLLQVWGAVFDRVTVRGHVGRIMLSAAILPGVATEEHQNAFDVANAEFYRKVRWALDISGLECTEFCVRGVPGRLIRRDPETQILITRERALAGSWRTLAFKEPLWPTTIDLFLQREEESTVLVAPRRHPKFARYMNDLRLLQAAGMTEQD